MILNIKQETNKIKKEYCMEQAFALLTWINKVIKQVINLQNWIVCTPLHCFFILFTRQP